MTTTVQKAKDKVSAARSQIMLARPLAFWTGLMVQVPWKVVASNDSNAPKTAYATIDEIVFNVDYINNLNVKEVGFLILHELSHILRQDVWRVGSRDPKRWNVASDLFINEAIINLSSCTFNEKDTYGKTLIAIPNILYFSNFQNGKYRKYISNDTETVYEALPEDIEASPTDELSTTNSKNKTQADKHKEDAKLRQIVSVAKEIAEQTNKDALTEAGSWIKDFVNQLLVPKVDWKLVLQDFMLSAAEQDWKWNRPHTSMFVTIGGIVPSLQTTPAIDSAVILLDSSASVDDNKLAQAWSEIKAMPHIINTLHVVHFTTEIEQVDTYDSSPEDIVPTERFEGGTAIDKTIDSLALKLESGELNAEVVIILSDMYSKLPEEPVGFPFTLWVNLASENTEFKAPFGVQITIE